MASTTQLTDGLDRLVSFFSANIKPSNGYTFDLTRRDAVQIGRVMQFPDRKPPTAPFVMVAFREELQRQGLGTGKNNSRIAEFDVIGWVRGQDIPLGGRNDYAQRARAGTLLFDDLEKAIIDDRRMAGLARDVFIRGTGFAGDIIAPWKAYGVAVGRVRIRFNWRAG